MQHPPVHRDLHIPRHIRPVDLQPARWDKSRDIQTHGGPQAHGFFEAGLEVRQVLGFGVGDGVGEGVGGVGGVDFGEEGGVGGWVGEEEVEEGLHGGCGGVGAGESDGEIS